MILGFSNTSRTSCPRLPAKKTPIRGRCWKEEKTIPKRGEQIQIVGIPSAGCLFPRESSRFRLGVKGLGNRCSIP